MKKMLKKLLVVSMCLLMISPFETYSDVKADDVGTTYYVSSKNGHDSNNGTSISTPFKTLNKINELTLGPNDQVLLECGSVFNDQYLHVDGSGEAQAPIIISSYGEGNMPIINTNAKGIWYQDYGISLDDPNHKNKGNVSSCILLYDVEYIEISNIEMTNSGSDPNGLVYNHVDYMNRTGVAAVAKDIGTVDHIVIRNCNIHDVNGNVYDKHMNNGGIYFTCFKPTNESVTGISRYNDVLIENNVLDTVNRWGIAVGYSAYHGQFTSAELADEIVIKYGSTNVIIRNNYLNEVGGDAITAMYCYRPLIEANVAEATARHINDTDYANSWRGQVAASIWAWKCKDCILQYNEVYDTYLNPDGQAWDADWGDGTLYQYNYSHNNLGGCYMICGVQAINSIFRYNISYLDKQDVLDLQNNPNGEIYNNTFIMDPNSKVVGMSGGKNTTVYNNIFYYTGSSSKQEDWFPDATEVDYESNLYYHYIAIPENDSSAIVDDPRFTNINDAPTSYRGNKAYEEDVVYNHQANGVFKGFTLLSDSPAINKGTYINNNGGYDFYGNQVVSTPDIGAHDTQTPDLCVYSDVYLINDEMKISQIPDGINVESFLSNLDYDPTLNVKVTNNNQELEKDTSISGTNCDLILTLGNVSKSYALETIVVDKQQLQILINTCKELKANDYTKESYRVFKDKLDKAIQVLSDLVVTQGEVDEIENELHNAMDALIPDLTSTNLINTEANKNSVSVIAYSSQCDSSMEGSGLGSAAASLDYNTSTYWHSDWSQDANKIMPQYIVYDLSENYYVSDITFLPRQSGNYINGDIFAINIYVSEDATIDVNDLVGSFTYEKHNGINLNSRDFHYAKLQQEKYGRYVKFEVTASGSHEGSNLFASMAEIRFYGTKELPVAKGALENAIDEGANIDSELYIKETLDVLNKVLNEGKMVLENDSASQEEVDAATKAIIEAIANLVKKPITPSVNKEALKASIATAEKIDTEGKTADSVAVLASALAAAKEVDANADATQAQVDEAKAALDAAVANLKDEPKEPTVPPMNFVDVKQGAWFYGSVESAYKKGLMSSTGKGKEYFEPDTPISRGMVATVLYRMAGLPKVEFKATFSDVTNPKLWYSTAITWASQAGVVSGYKDGSFGPDDNITRQDLAIMLRNFAKANGLDTNAKVDFSAFKDGNKVVSYAQSAVQFCIDAKLMSGAKKADGVYLNPSDKATRAECAKMFSLLDDAIKAK